MKLKIFALLILVISFSGCGPTQKITGFWSDPDAATMGPYSKIFVIVLSPDKDKSNFLELEIRKTLVSRGFKVVRFSDIFPPGLSISESYTKEMLAEAIKKTGSDAVLTLALLDSKVVESYNPGSTYSPMSYGFYGSYYGYYNYYAPVIYTPGYYSVDKTFYLETNAYDLASDKLLWSIQSEAHNPKDTESGFKTYSNLLTSYLKGKGLNKR
jgi:hypothetical protein